MENGTIKYDSSKKQWIIEAAQPHICIRLKQIFPKIPSHGIPPFEFANTPENCRELEWFMHRYPLVISKPDMKRMLTGKKEYISHLSDTEAILLPNYIPRDVILNPGYAARNYQLKAKDLILKVKRLLLGDDTGLGKTLSAIITMLEPNTLPATVTVQTHLPKQWKDEIEKYTNLKVHLIKGTRPYDLPEADVYIFKYSCLSGWVDVFTQRIFKTSIFDECQELRRRESAKYRGAKVLSDHVDHCVGLSATPVYNYGDEIFNILDLIKSGCLGDRDDFLREWASYIGKDRWMINDPNALGTYLRQEHLMLRRTRKEVNRELPPVNTIIHTVDYDHNEADKAEEFARMLAIKVTTASFVERGSAARELDAFVRHTTGVAKAHSVAAYVRILLENNEPVLLAGWHRKVYEIWLEELAEFNPVMYTGSESPAQKEKSKQAFISGETNLMIISDRSGVGLDGLQKRCSLVVIGELDWSPQVHHQLISRIDRDGQEQQVTAIYLVTDYGSDPVITELLGLKASQSHGILNPLESPTQKHTDESRIKKLAESFLNKKKSPAAIE